MELGRYRKVAVLGKGGMGIVHLAVARGEGGFEKAVALKELRPELSGDPDHVRMLLEEAKLGARLVHPNLVEVLDVGRDGERWFVALRLLDGVSLGRARSVLGARLPLRLFVRVLVEVLTGLAHAHAHGVVHRDVSPQNVHVGWDGRVTVIDFGVAKARGAGEATRAGVAKGSIPYMSPDHVSDRPIDGRADVFAVGILLREALTGERLWPRGAGDLEIVRRLVARDLPPLPPRAWVAAPPALRDACTRAMRADREERFATALEMRDALEAWLRAEDPRGALAELGELVARELPGERARVRRLLDEAPAERPRAPRPRRAKRIAAAALAAGLSVLAPALPLLDAEDDAPPAAPAPAVPARLERTLDREPRPAVLRPPIDPLDPGY